MDLLDEIIGAEMVTAVYGTWPSFEHNALVALNLKMVGDPVSPSFIVEGLIHCFETTEERDGWWRPVRPERRVP